MNSQLTPNQSQNIEILLDHILKISGDKIITLALHNHPFTIHIQANGQFGYQIDHKPLFVAKLHSALAEGGGMIIRQFLSIKVSRKLRNGKKGWLPEKNLYGVFFRNGEWIGLSAEAIQQACETDATTGEPLPQEEGVHYQAFPIP